MIDNLLLIDDDEIANFLVRKLVKKSKTVNSIYFIIDYLAEKLNIHQSLTTNRSVPLPILSKYSIK